MTSFENNSQYRTSFSNQISKNYPSRAAFGAKNLTARNLTLKSPYSVNFGPFKGVYSIQFILEGRGHGHGWGLGVFVNFKPLPLT